MNYSNNDELDYTKIQDHAIMYYVLAKTAVDDIRVDAKRELWRRFGQLLFLIKMESGSQRRGYGEFLKAKCPKLSEINEYERCSARWFAEEYDTVAPRLMQAGSDIHHPIAIRGIERKYRKTWGI